MTYNYSDPAVASLISTSHFPVELTTGTGPQPPNPQTLNLVCAKCYNPWPCQTIQDYRTYALANGLPGAVGNPLQVTFQTTGRLVPPRLT